MASTDDDASATPSIRSSSSFGSVQSAFSTDLRAADLVFLGNEHCRAQYTVSDGSGRSRGIICGRPVTAGMRDCSCVTHRGKGISRRPIGYYIRRKLKRGNALVAEDADPIPQSAYDDLLKTEAAEALARRNELDAAALELANIALGGADGEDSTQLHRPRVGIDTAANTYHSASNTEPSSAGNPAASQPGVAPPSQGPSSDYNAPPPINQSNTGGDTLFFLGHERSDGRRTYSNSEVEEARLRCHGWNVVAAFATLPETISWVTDNRAAAAAAGAPASATVTAAPPGPTEPTRLYLGHERADGRRSYSHSAAEEECLCRNGWNVVAFFNTLQEALEWVARGSRDSTGGGGNRGDGGDSTHKSEVSSPKKSKPSKKSSRHNTSHRKSSSSSRHRNYDTSQSGSSTNSSATSASDNSSSASTSSTSISDRKKTPPLLPPSS